MKKFFSEFKEFAIRGNVMDLTIGVIMGAAFKDVITAFTENIISPFLGLLVTNEFANWSFSVGFLTIPYGKFLTALINFLLMAIVVFLFVKGINRLVGGAKKQENEEKAEAPCCPYCLEEIAEGAKRCPHCTAYLDKEEER